MMLRKLFSKHLILEIRNQDKNLELDGRVKINGPTRIGMGYGLD